MSAGTWTVIRVNRGALCLAPDEETAKNCERPRAVVAHPQLKET